MDLVFFTLIICAFVAFYIYLTKNYNFWEKRGIPCVKNPLPGIGHLLPIIMQKTTYSDLCTKYYSIYKKHSMVGFYELRLPTLMVHEPELVKTVLQTNFDSFHKNFFELDVHLDPLLSKNPFFQTGEEWANGRKRITFAFSSMRLKMYTEIIQQVCKKWEDYVNRKLTNQERFETDAKDLFSRYTAEVVAQAGMGIEGKCFDDDIKPESVLYMGREIFKPTFSRGIINTLVFFFPILSKILHVPFLPKHVDTYFRKLVKEILEIRKKENTPRTDFFQLMMDMEIKNGVKLTDEIMAAHVISFFIDGFETSSVTIMFISYFIAKHPDVQQKLRKEIRSVLAKHNGVINYDAIKDLTYMSQVISEAQRLQPVLGTLLKVSTEKFVMKGADGLKCELPPGTKISIPIEGLHQDEKYWPDPKKFDPDRFSEENKGNLTKFCFLPFGDGPRACVGMRMGLLQVKTALIALLNKFSIELSPKTREPLVLDPAYFLRCPYGGIWLYVKHIDE